ncbi:MAG TPA: sigma-54-dependent Fis family transcriptional regulator [candidate division Zixibacteria bacterium]|nr:sigma-54-dependent Fis family transcriptional regulator [candidate division Zixibacteria bacterium]
MQKILIVDDEIALRQSLNILLARHCYSVETADSANQALSILENEHFDMVITDLRMKEMNGLELLRRIKTLYPEIEVIVLTAFGSIGGAVEAMKAGAFDYVTKPFKNEQLLVVVEKALERRKLISEVKYLREALRKDFSEENMVAQSPQMMAVMDLVRKIAPQNLTVLISGDSGTGKEVVAKVIHNLSARRDDKFFAINCSAMPEQLLESELFGCANGAFTGASCAKKGLLEMASGGTLLLDEIADMPLTLQAKILRVLDEKAFCPVGSNAEIEIDVRILAATTRDLAKMVKAGTFREDLYYRLDVIRVHIPPLSERCEDIMPLAEHFLRKYSDELGKPGLKMDSSAVNTLMNYDWPGNVRELKNTVKRAVALTNRDILDQDDIFFAPNVIGHPRRLELRRPPETNTLEDTQREHIRRTLVSNKWNYTRTSKELGIGRTTLWRKVKKYNLKPETAVLD